MIKSPGLTNLRKSWKILEDLLLQPEEVKVEIKDKLTTTMDMLFLGIELECKRLHPEFWNEAYPIVIPEHLKKYFG